MQFNSGTLYPKHFVWGDESRALSVYCSEFSYIPEKWNLFQPVNKLRDKYNYTKWMGWELEQMQ